MALDGTKSSTRRKFTRTPKMEELVGYGVPLRAIPTYLALSDHADNQRGATIVSVEKVAEILKVCRRTVERHLAALEACGVIRRQYQRRTKRGRFSSCLCVVISFALFTVRHQESRGPRREKARTKPLRNHPPVVPPGGKSEEEIRAEARKRRRQQMAEVFGPDAV